MVFEELQKYQEQGRYYLSKMSETQREDKGIAPHAAKRVQSRFVPPYRVRRSSHHIDRFCKYARAYLRHFGRKWIVEGDEQCQNHQSMQLLTPPPTWMHACACAASDGRHTRAHEPQAMSVRVCRRRCARARARAPPAMHACGCAAGDVYHTRAHELQENASDAALRHSLHQVLQDPCIPFHPRLQV